MDTTMEENIQAFTVKTENGEIRLMTHEEVNKFVRQTIMRVKSTVVSTPNAIPKFEASSLQKSLVFVDERDAPECYISGAHEIRLDERETGLEERDDISEVIDREASQGAPDSVESDPEESTAAEKDGSTKNVPHEDISLLIRKSILRARLARDGARAKRNDTPAASERRFDDAYSPVGTVSRKFSWSSVEEEQSTDESDTHSKVSERRPYHPSLEPGAESTEEIVPNSQLDGNVHSNLNLLLVKNDNPDSAILKTQSANVEGSSPRALEAAIAKVEGEAYEKRVLSDEEVRDIVQASMGQAQHSAREETKALFNSSINGGSLSPNRQAMQKEIASIALQAMQRARASAKIRRTVRETMQQARKTAKEEMSVLVKKLVRSCDRTEYSKFSQEIPQHSKEESITFVARPNSDDLRDPMFIPKSPAIPPSGGLLSGSMYSDHGESVVPTVQSARNTEKDSPVKRFSFYNSEHGDNFEFVRSTNVCEVPTISREESAPFDEVIGNQGENVELTDITEIQSSKNRDSVYDSIPPQASEFATPPHALNHLELEGISASGTSKSAPSSPNAASHSSSTRITYGVDEYSPTSFANQAGTGKDKIRPSGETSHPVTPGKHVSVTGAEKEYANLVPTSPQASSLLQRNAENDLQTQNTGNSRPDTFTGENISAPISPTAAKMLHPNRSAKALVLVEDGWSQRPFGYVAECGRVGSDFCDEVSLSQKLSAVSRSASGKRNFPSPTKRLAAIPTKTERLHDSIVTERLVDFPFSPRSASSIPSIGIFSHAPCLDDIIRHEASHGQDDVDLTDMPLPLKTSSILRKKVAKKADRLRITVDQLRKRSPRQTTSSRRIEVSDGRDQPAYESDDSDGLSETQIPRSRKSRISETKTPKSFLSDTDRAAGRKKVRRAKKQKARSTKARSSPDGSTWKRNRMSGESRIPRTESKSHSRRTNRINKVDLSHLDGTQSSEETTSDASNFLSSRSRLESRQKTSMSHGAVITDEFLARVASRKGSKITAKELQLLLEVARSYENISLESDAVAKPAGTDQGQRPPSPDVLSIPSFERKQPRFCMGFMEFWDEVDDLIDSEDFPEEEEYTLHSAPVSSIDSDGYETIEVATDTETWSPGHHVSFSFSIEESDAADSFEEEEKNERGAKANKGRSWW
jgi:hypothetical protein